MATAFSTALSLRGSTIIKSFFPGSGTVPLRWGNQGMPSGIFNLQNGTGATQSNIAFLNAFSINATSSLDIDLTSGQTDPSGAAVVMTKIKWIYWQLTSPASGDKVRVGPQGVTNANQLWFQAATTNFYTETQMGFMGDSNSTGVTVDATHKIIRLYNPGATTITGYFLAGGIA